MKSNSYFQDGAAERTRTSTSVRKLAPEASASTNSATAASLCAGGGPPAASRARTIGADRKSAGYGTSVSVRVDLGGRHIIKKNLTQQHHHVTHHESD